MNRTEVNALLYKAGMIDARVSKLSIDKVNAWFELVDGVTFDEANTALVEHYRTSTDAVMPAHVLAIVNRNRRDVQQERHDQQVRAELEAAKDGVLMPAELREAFEQDAKVARAKLRAMWAKPIPFKSLTDEERAAKVAEAKAELDERWKAMQR